MRTSVVILALAVITALLVLGFELHNTAARISMFVAAAAVALRAFWIRAPMKRSHDRT